MWPQAGAPEIFFNLMHPMGPELPNSAHVAYARVCRQLYVLRTSHALVQATVGVGTAIIVYIGVADTKGGGGVTASEKIPSSWLKRQTFHCTGSWYLFECQCKPTGLPKVP